MLKSRPIDGQSVACLGLIIGDHLGKPSSEYRLPLKLRLQSRGCVEFYDRIVLLSAAVEEVWDGLTEDERESVVWDWELCEEAVRLWSRQPVADDDWPALQTELRAFVAASVARIAEIKTK